MRNAWVLWRMDVLRRQRAWTVRVPGLLPTRRHVVALVVTLAVAVTVATCLVLVGVLPAAGEGRDRLLEGGAALLLVLALLRVLTGLSPAGAVTAYEQADLRLVSRTPLRGADLYLGRVWLTQLVPQAAGLLLLGLAVAVAALVTGTPARALVPLAGAGLLYVAASGLAMTLSCLLFTLVLRLPPVLVGPGLFGLGLLVPVALTTLAVSVSPVLLAAGREGGDLTSWPGALLSDPRVESVLAVVRTPEGLALCGAATALALAAGLAVAHLALPTNLHRVRSRLSGGHRWRTTRPFPLTPARATADKDLRLLLRRGLPAWQLLDDVLTLLPVLVGVGLAGQVVAATSADPFLGHLATLANAGLVVVILGMASEALTPLLTSDADGPTLRLLRWHPAAYRGYLAAKSAVAATILAVVGIACAGLVHTVAPWPGAALGAMAVVAVVAAVGEAVCVVVGSAHRPALFRKDLGIADLEPSVRLASGVVTAVVVTTTTPLVVLASVWTGAVPVAVTVLAVLAAVPVAHATAGRLAPAVHRNLVKGDTRATAARRRAATGV
ncbi:hypothetical protein M3148_15275 [Georgenia satyanarayanai]|uniref:hypothetical protein n=1 Tax=Georgenia satyanarayanai TaxID=860221 RepID=UPI00203BE370|nr:hypothetical protein [Georgenia satyanarayanai]MCM3662340.1 hypothetical protein [Georgenia satyanarayanai]